MKSMKKFLGVVTLFLFGIMAVHAESVSWDSTWEFADYSVIHSGTSTMYTSSSSNKKDLVVAVNAGHGTTGGEQKETYCHPDLTPKVTGGSTAKGATKAKAVSSGMTFSDGTAEPVATLAVAQKLKNLLLEQGYDVLMIRDGSDVQLDNVARTMMANNLADIHIAIHFDSTSSDKGAFYMSVPSDASYRAMYPVSEHWQSHHELGNALISGLRSAGVKINGSGSMEMDLTQTSYSTIPSVDIELGDHSSDHSDAAISKYAKGLLNGILEYDGEEHVTVTSNSGGSQDGDEEGNGSSGTAQDLGGTYTDIDPLTPGGLDDDCETIFMNADGTFNDFGNFVQDIFTVLKFLAPLLVIVLSTIDYIKAITAQNADEMKKANGRFVKRLIAGVAIFLLPFLLDFLFEIFGLYGLSTCNIR